MRKRGQITGVILIIIILTLILAVTYYLSSSITEKSLEKERALTYLGQSRVDPIQEYVTSCVNLVAKEGVVRLGHQGGFLYISQGGPIADPQPPRVGVEYVPYRDRDILFGTRKPDGPAGPFSYDLPEYPYTTFPEITVSGEIRDAYVGFYGYQVLPELRKPTRKQNSIQEQLELYVNNNLAGCLDWSQFEQQNLRISTEETSTEVTFTEKETIFVVNYPIQIVDTRTNAQARIEQFETIFKIDMIELYDFIKRTTEKDASDVAFNLNQVEDGRFSADRDRNVYEHDDVVSYMDKQSDILGKPYVFRVAIQNRPPALELLDKREYQAQVNDFEICGSYNQDGDYLPAVMSFDPVENIFRIKNPRPQCPEPLEIPVTVLDSDEDSTEKIFELGGLDVPMPYRIPEKYIGNPLKIKVKVTDGEFTDWQILTFDTYFVGQKE